jgi:hypothetical protein
MVQYLLKHFENSDFDTALVDALFTAILVRYSRPFASGVRLRLGDDVLTNLTDTQRAAHDKFYLWRDKHIAHSVNAFEEKQLVARYWVEKVHIEGITEVAVNHTRLFGLSSADLLELIDLIAALLPQVEARIASERPKVLAVVRALPIDQVISKSPKSPSILNFTKIGKRRK